MDAIVKRFRQLPKPVQQLVMGASAGWLTGFSLMKFGKGAGCGVGATIFIVQIGQHYGYININWNQVNDDLNKAKKEVKKQADSHMPVLVDRIESAIKDNIVLATSFAGGFLLGASSA